ncbi:gliding motility-associated C-terminal domain-containing protein [Flavobacterium sp. CBA20B-1]|uniref:gliding motility-associated C-terminal domain-containing protein n=1 Tax=unclassified Flavobacterium TaxID=196869 RepID=UPI0022255AA9|nr:MULTISPECIES: gliding motility-associated C-terminal domain-containing protein [unclassified Flavobacterium]WCM41298.1 gliding motility-associated C-terminal domain-containing protein [Flavobacterium sp. CBA20B-1]
MRNIFINIGLLYISLTSGVYAQVSENIAVNHGELYVLPNTIISTQFNFDNKASGVIFNDGEFQFYKNYNNDGLFTHSTNQNTGYTVFQGTQQQTISGSQPSKHFDVLFNNTSSQYPFNLNSDMIINGVGNFREGIVRINKNNGGKLLFGNGASQMNATDRSYAEGMVEKQGKDAFTFPIGKLGYYRLAGISAPSDVAHTYLSEYFKEDTNQTYPHKDRTGIISAVNNQEYWTINQSAGTTGSVMVTLSWHDQTTPAEFRGVQDLHIVRWDPTQNLWVDEGGIVDETAKTVTTPVQVDGFGIFTLGKIKEKFLNPGDVVVYNGVSPDGDGMNDYLIIDNIEHFPENSVVLYNRWGRKVYETKNYNSKNNVFVGIAEGNGIVGSGEKLPIGTYYYVVEYLYNRNGENQWIKKVGYIHLENQN